MPKLTAYDRFAYEGKLGTEYKFRKFDPEEIEPLGVEYIIKEDKVITNSSGPMVCNCPAYRVVCRHLKMMPIFDRAENGDDPEYTEILESGHRPLLIYDPKGSHTWIKGMMQ